MYVLYFYDLFHILFVGVTKFSVCGMYNIYVHICIVICRLRLTCACHAYFLPTEELLIVPVD